jgi:hypothetical protein
METGQMLGRLGDISSEGIMLLSSKVIPLEKTYRIAVCLPKNSSFRQEKLELSVETRWLKPDFNPSILCIGCHFKEAAPEKDSVMQMLIEYYGFSDGYKKFKPAE